MSDFDSASQEEVYEWYNENARTAATVGDYIRVVVHNKEDKACFGPLADTPGGWKVVEIDWVAGEFLIAPVDEVYDL